MTGTIETQHIPENVEARLKEWRQEDCVLGLPADHGERQLEEAILRELERFFL